MNTGVRRDWRTPVAAVAALLGACPLPAQEKSASAPPAETRDATEALLQAQRELALIKAARDGVTAPSKSGAPQLQVPDFSPPASVSAGVRPRPPATESKSSNWLVDAMKKEPVVRESRRGGSEEREKEWGDAAPLREREKEAASSSRSGRDLVDAKERTTTAARATNPLDRYLGNWMSPQDYALLKPVATESTGQFGDWKRDGGLDVPSGISGTAPGDAPALNGLLPADRPDVAGVNAASRKENPFLQALNAPPVPATLPPPVAKAAPASGAPVPAPFLAPVSTAPVAAEAGAIPAFARPSESDKYFKQLRRF